MTIKRLNTYALLLIVWIVSSQSAMAFENKVDFTAGFFSISGRNSRTGQSASVSGLAAYHLGYRRAVSDRFDVGLGYTLAFSSVISGDSVFGLDVSGHYYPFTAANAVDSRSDSVSLVISESFRPFVGLSFLQRNFQGIQTTYVGFGGSVGTEYSLNAGTSLIGRFKYASLNANSDSTATEMVIEVGLSLGF